LEAHICLTNLLPRDSVLVRNCRSSKVDVLVHGPSNTNKPGKYKVGGHQLKLFGSLVERVQSGLDFHSQIDEDVRRGNDIHGRRGDCVPKAATFAARGPAPPRGATRPGAGPTDWLVKPTGTSFVVFATKTKDSGPLFSFGPVDYSGLERGQGMFAHSRATKMARISSGGGHEPTVLSPMLLHAPLSLHPLPWKAG
jgi:hypothetical protein